ncbi:VP91 capsid [Choristoneura occidentalis granulovirus]|uniref:VP91 capsid n=1 Tax=Choristoneura occidentalis granulovirus TaxID=364745 RepID=Q1A4L6_9BBAC|nr:VP91 capsid [Choristoneura fumiferana granulovirus]ABC61214.1 VP91 capsid [Choristoneura fumiferana granulovirus]
MLSISSVLLVIILFLAVYLFYNKFVINDFNNESYLTRLNVLKEYLKLVGGENRDVVPSKLAFVTDVQKNKYVVTYFDTNTLKIIGGEVKDETKEIFNFATQSFESVNTNPDAASISFLVNDNKKFVVHADDGDLIMECNNNGVFDGKQCAVPSICEGANIKLPLTEERLNRLIFNTHQAQQRPFNEINESKHHPTAYIQCDTNMVPHIEECLNGETFVDNKCVYDPTIITNGQGTVIFYNHAKLTKFNLENNHIDTNFNKHHNNLRISEPEVIEKEIKLKNSPEKIALIKRQNYSTKNVSNVFDEKLNFKKKIALIKHNVKYFTKNKPKLIKEKFNLKNSPEKIALIKHEVKNFAKNIEQNNYMIPVNYVHPFDILPCIKHGVGYKFTTNKLANTQFLECLDNNNLFLHTCKSVVDSKFECDQEMDCMQFDNGTGSVINTINSFNITFDTGKSVCKDYKIKQILECDTGDFVTTKSFNHPLQVKLNLNLPKQIYDADADACMDYDVQKISVTNDGFTIDVVNYPELKTSMIGRVSKILNRKMFDKTDKITSFVTYSRDVDEIAMNPNNFNALDCFDDKQIVVDILDNTKYNFCNNNMLDEEIHLKLNEYVENGIVKKDLNYKGQCHYKKGEDYFNLYHRQIDGYNCFFTIPKTFEL